MDKQEQLIAEVESKMSRIEGMADSSFNEDLPDQYIDTLESCDTCSCGRTPLTKMVRMDLKVLSGLLSSLIQQVEEGIIK